MENLQIGTDDLLIVNDFTLLDNPDLTNRYGVHLFCTQGTATFIQSDSLFTLKADECIISCMRKPLTDIIVSEDFACVCFLMDLDLMTMMRPSDNYSIKGTIGMMLNPVLSMSHTDMQLILKDIELISQHFACPDHQFYWDVIQHTFQTFVFDMYNIHRRVSAHSSSSKQISALMNRFFQLLQSGMYKTDRKVASYASALCITPIYLYEVSKTMTGNSPSRWIDFFTTAEIRRLLSDASIPIGDIADRLHFPSFSYFSRYVQRTMHSTPSDIRARKKKNQSIG